MGCGWRTPTLLRPIPLHTSIAIRSQLHSQPTRRHPIETSVRHRFPWAFVDKCAHNDRKQRNNDKCKCGLSICDAGKYCDNTNLITQCHDEPFCANTDRKNRNTERCNCGLGNICDANKYCKWGQCFDDVWKPVWQSDSRRRRSGF